MTWLRSLAQALILLVLMTAAHVDGKSHHHPRRHKGSPKTLYVENIESPDHWRELTNAVRAVDNDLGTLVDLRLVVVKYTASWCGRACQKVSDQFAEVARYFARMKIFNEVVIAEAEVDTIGITELLAEQHGVVHFPAVVLYGPHLKAAGKAAQTSKGFLVYSGSPDRESLIDFVKDHIVQVHEHNKAS